MSEKPISKLRIRWIPKPLWMLAFLLAGCAQQRTIDRANEFIARGEYERGVAILEAGAREYSDSAKIRGDLISLRSAAFSDLLKKASDARNAGQFAEAERLLKRAAEFDTSGDRVAPLLRQIEIARDQSVALQRARQLLNEGKPDAAEMVINDALRSDPQHPNLLELRSAVELRLSEQHPRRPELEERRSVSLDFKDANLRAVLDVVSRTSGVNFVLDKDVRPDARITIYLKSAKLDDALQAILQSQQLARKVLDERTVLIYPNSPEKLRDYQEQVVKVFYLANGDPKGAAAFLKASVGKLREPFIDEKNNLLSLRDSPENIALAARLLAMFDHPEPEVLIDAEVLEVNADRLTELGVDLPSQVTLAPIVPAGGTLTLNSFPLHSSGVGVNVGSVAINLRRETGDVNMLANPRIRARSHEKAKILIGDRIPTITTTTTPGVAGFVSETVNYQDVGIKLEVEPTVFPDDDVAIRLNLEVSALGTQIKTASGTVAYQISTRNASTLLRLHDGETQLLGGLISRNDRSSAAGLPGLSDLPILGRLFGDHTDSHSKTELVLAITPHLVRAQPHPDAAESEAWVGTEASPRLKPVGGRYDTNPVDALAPKSGIREVRPSSAIPAAAAPGASAPMASAVPGSGSEPTGGSVEPGEAPTLRWQAPSDSRVGQLFVMDLLLRSGQPVGDFKVSIKYPTDRLGLVGVLPPQGTEAVEATGDPAVHIGNDGQGIIELSRRQSTSTPAPLSIVRLQFKAQAVGDASIGLNVDSQSEVKPALPSVVVVKLTP